MLSKAEAGSSQTKLASEADEHEQALALEMGFQRRQWDLLQKLQRQMDEQVAKTQELERCLQEQAGRHRAVEKQVELHRQEAQDADAGLAERCSEERSARQKELRGVQASMQALDGKFDEMLSKAVWSLTHSHQQGQQELRCARDAMQRRHEELEQSLSSRCKDLERLLTEELRNSIAGIERKSSEMARETSKECAELVHGCTGRCADLDQQLAEERSARQRELHGLQASIQALDGRFEDRLREVVQDLTESQHKGHLELRSACDAVQQDLVQDLGSRCKDLERLFMEELRNSIAGLERKSNEMIRETTKDLSKLMHSKHQEHADLVRDCTGHCTDLGRQAAEDRAAQQRELLDLRGALGEVDRKCGDLVRSLAKELHEKHSLAGCRSAEAERRISRALQELATRVDTAEHDITSHTHRFTSKKTYESSLAIMPSASSPTACDRGRLPNEDISSISTVAGSEMSGVHGR